MQITRGMIGGLRFKDKYAGFEELFPASIEKASLSNNDDQD